MADAMVDRRKAAVQSMFRVRASESPAGADGLRTVWHQGGEGADLTSTVDAQGRVVRQEFVLFEERLLWVAETGLSTGKIRDEKAAGGIKGSPLVAMDDALDEVVLAHMSQALAGYADDDKYLRHLAKVVTNALEGLRDLDPAEVSVAAGIARPLPSDGASAPSGAGPARNVMLLAGAVLGMAVVVVVAVLLLLLLR